MSKALEEEEGRQGLVASEQPWKEGLSQRSGQQKGRGRQRCEKGHRVGKESFTADPAESKFNKVWRPKSGSR